MDNLNDETTTTNKCIRCSNGIDTYNLCMNERNGRVCKMCLYVEDMTCLCNDKNPTDIKEEYRQDYNGNVKENTKIFNLEGDVIMRVCDNSFIKQQNNEEIIIENLKLKDDLKKLKQQVKQIMNQIGIMGYVPSSDEEI